MKHEEHSADKQPEARAEKIQMHVWIVNMTSFPLTPVEVKLKWGKVMLEQQRVEPYQEYQEIFASQGRENTWTGTEGTAVWKFEDGSVLGVTFNVPWSGENSGEVFVKGGVERLIELRQEGPNPHGDVAQMTIVMKERMR